MKRDPDTTIGRGSGRFPTTRRSAVLAATSEDREERTRALDLLVTLYWRPVYRHLRIHWSRSNEDAKDLTQGFFALAIERNVFGSYDPARGTFRTFLRTCLDRYVSNEAKGSQAASRSRRAMRWISDEAVSRLREVADAPDFSGTRYRIERELGRGGMGVVWAATDLDLQREVAVKVLPAWESSEDAATRLRREARILAQLEHPGIVPIHDLGQLADGRIFYAMKLVRGERLDSYLDRSALPLQERLRLFERFCEPVAFAHARGIAHRDLKPANVMVGSFGEILVLDWDSREAPTHHGVEEPRGTWLPNRRQAGPSMPERTSMPSERF